MPLETGSSTGNSNYDAVLKDYYEGPVRSHIQNKVTILRHVDKSKRKWNGRRVFFPLHLSRNEGVGARAENVDLPAAGKQGYVESVIEAKYLYGRIELTGPVIAASQGDKGAFATALAQEVKGMRNDLRNDTNRQVWGNPVNGINTGIMCQLSANADEDAVAIACDNEGTRYLKKNMAVVIGSHADLNNGGSAGVAATISSVDSTTAATVPALAGDTLNNDFVVRGDARGTSYQNEITGLSFIVDDDDSIDLQSVDVSDNTEFKSSVFGASGVNRDLSLELMQLAIDACDEKGGEEPDLIMGHHSMRREYINLLTSDVRYAPEQLRGGHKTLTYAGGSEPMPIEFDKHAPYNKLWFIRSSDIKQYVQKDWGWADRDGAILSRVSSRDSWEAFMCYYGNLGCEVRNTHAVVEDLNASNLIF